MYSELKQFGRVKINVPLSKLSTFGVGGLADFVIEVEETEKLVALLNFLSAEGADYFVLGGGSNILFSDDGFRGVVIKVKGQRSKVKGLEIEAEAGAALGAVLNLAIKNNLSGLEWAAGIPGTVGGAVRGNAGARFDIAGGETGESIERVEVWRDGEILELSQKECGFGYRESIFKRNRDVVLRAWFKLAPGDAQKSLAVTQAIIKMRQSRTAAYPSAGSFFKNPRWDNISPEAKKLAADLAIKGKVPTGRLIDSLGLRGFKVGGAMVSDEHGNFIVNYNGATQADVLNLVEKIKEKVYNKYRIELEEEVQII